MGPVLGQKKTDEERNISEQRDNILSFFPESSKAHKDISELDLKDPNYAKKQNAILNDHYIELLKKWGSMDKTERFMHKEVEEQIMKFGELLNAIETGNFDKLIEKYDKDKFICAVVWFNALDASKENPEAEKKLYEMAEKGELTLSGIFSIAKDTGILNSLLERMQSDFQKAMEEYKRQMQESESKEKKKPKIPPIPSTPSTGAPLPKEVILTLQESGKTAKNEEEKQAKKRRDKVLEKNEFV